MSKDQHWDFLHTLLIVDHERKHSLTPVKTETDIAIRDMLIFFTRSLLLKVAFHMNMIH
ncbi:2OG-Fe dioxygenase family protein [Elizabethkingia argenteiflava]|uniref:2OG-Fe dioxygenase family protein n=1 Tax=Elizabethkingia argenteiflava TaxID=2681556 RepID=UPI0037443379